MIKIGHKVYMYRESADGMGEILSGVVAEASKNLATGKITYSVRIGFPALFGFIGDGLLQCREDQLYKSEKAIMREYKDELAYGALFRKLDGVERLLANVLSDCRQKLESPDYVGLSCCEAKICDGSLLVKDRDVLAEIDDVKAELEKLKKKLRPKTKKAVKKTEE